MRSLSQMDLLDTLSADNELWHASDMIEPHSNVQSCTSTTFCTGPVHRKDPRILVPVGVVVRVLVVHVHRHMTRGDERGVKVRRIDEH